ncbi:epidermal retinol dehydrogenase 2-like [Homarus americanus]|uniref:epidermal retinol dehydrogenase 2-like n=1 Tax=Homarus americanus TaxID=6706 RepID=UPI001C46D38D|nr:epidermal retinol dehydrogenase 2-like [Homarus americanus]XP_042230888.1 epidermal retinol dehydrogenase 2-like [Homarus americanus]XP_042230889.1 epidermal retinol dehydrogenase 2-like [Homarus americanus]XP_042230890.1 epidermal retinol dehydrogenase 2-like [Homarus americanus]
MDLTGKEIAILVLRLLFGLVYSVYCMVETLVLTLIPRSYRRKDIRGNVTLVTGGGSGIGRLMCIKLAARGAIVVTWDVNEEGNLETVRQVVAAGGQCRAYTVDLCNRHAIYAAATKLKQEVGKVDILVNNAGIVTGKKLLDSPDESIIKTFEVNILSHFWTTKAFLADMMARNKGHIVTIASMAGKIPCNRLVDYCSSKFAAVGFDESLRLELQVEGKTGIKTTVVCPVFISTGMFEGMTSKIFPVLKPEYVADETVDGILLNTPIVYLPLSAKINVFLGLLLPQKVLYYLSEAVGLTHMMDTFVGRKKTK